MKKHNHDCLDRNKYISHFVLAKYKKQKDFHHKINNNILIMIKFYYNFLVSEIPIHTKLLKEKNMLVDIKSKF